MNFSRNPKTLISLMLLLGIAVLSVGCGSDTVSPSTDGTITVGVASETTTLSSSLLSSGKGVANASALSSIDITKAEVVLTRIRFKSAVGEDTLDFRSDDPLVINLDLSGAIQTLGSISVPPGTYDEARYRLNSLDECTSLDSCTAAHILTFDSNPNLQGYSVRIEGYVDGFADSTFIWATALDKDQVIDLAPFSVVAGEVTNVTFYFDVNSWLSDGSGGVLDPRDLNNYSQIENNIQNDFDARSETQF